MFKRFCACLLLTEFSCSVYVAIISLHTKQVQAHDITVFIIETEIMISLSKTSTLESVCKGPILFLPAFCEGVSRFSFGWRCRGRGQIAIQMKIFRDHTSKEGVRELSQHKPATAIKWEPK